MKKLYWYNLIVFGLLVLAPHVFDFFYSQRNYSESLQYLVLFFHLLGGTLLTYKNIKFFYNKKEISIKNRLLPKIITRLFIFFSIMTILVGLFFLAIQYGSRHGIGL